MAEHNGNFHSPLRVAVIGAAGGIGNALLRALESGSAGQDLDVAELYAFARDPDRIDAKRAQQLHIDVLDESSIAAAAESAAAKSPLDLVIVSTGLLHREGGERPAIQPEKALRDLDATSMAEVFAVNSVAPAMLAKHFLPALRKTHKSVFAVLSARVGSIEDNRLGGWASYRASKAALNMLLRTFSIEQRRQNSNSIIAALHPGTVDTSLSKPFQKRVPDNQLFSPEQSAAYLLAVINSLQPSDSGGFFAWDGQPIPY